MTKREENMEKTRSEISKILAAERLDVIGRFRRKILELVLLLYAFSGLLVALFGGYLLVVSELDLGAREKTIAAIIMVSILVSMVSLLINHLMNRREISRREKALSESNALISRLIYLEMIEEWSRFEETAKALLSTGERPNIRLSIPAIMDDLQKTDALTPIDLEALKYSLQVRNRIAHGKIEEINPSEVRFLLNRLKTVTDRIALSLRA